MSKVFGLDWQENAAERMVDFMLIAQVENDLTHKTSQNGIKNTGSHRVRG